MSYHPPTELQSFLEAGPPPVYIGFGSIVVDDSSSLTVIVIEALKKIGHRAIIAAGWSSLGGAEADSSTAPPDIFVLREDCPHGWLFSQVSCVVHHGGAGTTAAGIRAGRPTVVVPFSAINSSGARLSVEPVLGQGQCRTAHSALRR